MDGNTAKSIDSGKRRVSSNKRDRNEIKVKKVKDLPVNLLIHGMIITFSFDKSRDDENKATQSNTRMKSVCHTQVPIDKANIEAECILTQVKSKNKDKQVPNTKKKASVKKSINKENPEKGEEK